MRNAAVRRNNKCTWLCDEDSRGRGRMKKMCTRKTRGSRTRIFAAFDAGLTSRSVRLSTSFGGRHDALWRLTRAFLVGRLASDETLRTNASRNQAPMARNSQAGGGHLVRHLMQREAKNSQTMPWPSSVLASRCTCRCERFSDRLGLSTQDKYTLFSSLHILITYLIVPLLLFGIVTTSISIHLHSKIKHRFSTHLPSKSRLGVAPLSARGHGAGVL